MDSRNEQSAHYTGCAVVPEHQMRIQNGSGPSVAIVVDETPYVVGAVRVW